MRYREILTEMPISSWTVAPDFDANEKEMVSKFTGYDREQRHWSAADKNAIRSPKQIAKIKSVFERIPYKFNFYFWQSSHPDYDRTLEKGQVSLNWVKDHLSDSAYDYVVETMTADSITVLMTNNLSDENKISIASPWNIGHRTAHTILGGSERSSLARAFVGICFDSAERILARVYGYQFHDNHHIRRDEVAIMTKMLGEVLGTMASARNGRLVTHFEWVYATFTQYLIKGKVVLNKTLPESFDDLSTSPEKIALGRKMIVRLETVLNAKCAEILDDCLGKLYVM